MKLFYEKVSYNDDNVKVKKDPFSEEVENSDLASEDFDSIIGEKTYGHAKSINERLRNEYVPDEDPYTKKDDELTK